MLNALPKVKETVSEARKTKLSLKVSEALAFLATCKIVRVHHFSFLCSLPSYLISILQIRFFLPMENTAFPESSLFGFKTVSQILKGDQEVLSNISSLEESHVFSQRPLQNP